MVSIDRCPSIYTGGLQSIQVVFSLYRWSSVYTGGLQYTAGQSIVCSKASTSELSKYGHDIIQPSLQRTQLEVPKYLLLLVPIHSEPPKEDNLPTKDKITDFIFGLQSHHNPEVPLFDTNNAMSYEHLSTMQCCTTHKRLL